MSWLKFWGKKTSKKEGADKRSRSDLIRSESFKDESAWQPETEKEKNARLRHTMSISRSGRFKQKNKQRSGILDKPEFYNGTNNTDGSKENWDNANSQSGTNYTEKKRTPPSTCRDVASRQPITARHFEGHQTVLDSDQYLESFNEIEVWVDGQLRASGSTIGDYIMLTSSVLYVAGSPNTYSLPGSETRVNFKGCMKQVNYFGDSLELDLVDLVQKDHNLITNMGAIVGMCEEIRDSQPVTFTTPGAFIALPRWDVQLRNHGTIEFQFRTTEPDGLLIFNSGKYGTNNADFIAMELMDGYFYLVLNLGSGAIKEKVSKTNVDDGMPHLVYFEYNGQTGLIRVDNHEIEYNTPGTGKQLDLEDMFYIGGLDFERYGTYKLPKEMWAGVLKNGFVGCVQDLVINTVKIDLMTVARKQMQRDIRPECSKISNQCASQPCLHNGVCREGWNRYICDCRSTAYTGKNCEYAATTLTFDKSQYVVVNLPEESRTEADDISLRFRTAKDNGLLVMTRSADFGDSLELFLERGACKLTISAGPKSQTLTMGRGLNDDHWHTVFIKRRGQNIQYWVDPNSPVRATIVGTTTLRVKQIAIGSVGPLMTGAQPLLADGTHSSELLQEHPWFVGDMQQFIFNKNYYFDMAQEPQSEHIRVTARFDSGDALANDAVTFQSQETYVALPHQLLKSNSKHFSISFKFKTSQTSGLILYCGKGPDFLALELENGYMYYVYDMGGGSKRIHVNTPEPLNDNRWHDLSLFRPETDQQQIRIDNNPSTVEDMKGYSGRQFNLKGSLYVGGLAKSEFYALSVKTISSRNGFLGCIAALDINGARIDILETAEYIKNTQDHTVVRGCAVSDVTCQPGLCEHGGVCEKQWNSFICNCDMTTFTGPRCTQQSVTYQIGLGKGLIVFEYPEDERPSTKSDYLALGIRTNLNERAIILRIDSADHDDFIEMELVNGDIYMVYNLGRDSHPIVLLNKKVNDGKYHEIKFVRNEFNAMLQVDYEKQNKTPAGGTMTTFNKQARIMLGGRKTSTGAISQGFQGTISGFVFNGMRILDLLEAGDERLRIEGDVTLIPSSTMVPPEGVKIPDPDDIKQLQSTQGFKLNSHRHKRSGLDAGRSVEELGRKVKQKRKSKNRRKEKDKNSSKRKGEKKNNKNNSNSNKHRNRNKKARKKWRKINSCLDPSKCYFIHKNLIQQGIKAPKFDEIGNEIVEGKTTKITHDVAVIENAVQKVHHEHQTVSSLEDKTEMDDGTNHLLDKTLTIPKTPINHSIDFHNNDTVLAEIKEPKLRQTKVLRKKKRFRKRRRQRYKTRTKGPAAFKKPKTSLGISSQNKHSIKESHVHIEFDTNPGLALDNRLWKQQSYPKDPGIDEMRRSRRGRKSQHSSNQEHSRGSTPSQDGSDDIIFSGLGPSDCYSDDDDDCRPVDGSNSDDIITPAITVTRISTPKPDPIDSNIPYVKEGDPLGTEMQPNIYSNATGHPDNINHGIDEGPNTVESTHATKARDNGHLNIFLIIGIGAGILVALIILAVALYKFRSREEGSYRVDESQNFAYLEAKKQQSNGNAANIGNGKSPGKKRDVKEWYV